MFAALEAANFTLWFILVWSFITIKHINNALNDLIFINVSNFNTWSAIPIIIKSGCIINTVLNEDHTANSFSKLCIIFYFFAFNFKSLGSTFVCFFFIALTEFF